MKQTAYSPSAAGRIDALDVLRGLAICGILVVNVEQMFLPDFYANDPVAVQPGAFAETTVWFLTDSLFRSKFLAVFCLLFGAGFSLQFHRAKRVGLGRPFKRRLLLLGVFGVLHAAFFYWADVLLIYALTAIPLARLRHLTPRRLMQVGSSLLAVSLVLSALLMGPDEAERAARQRATIATIDEDRGSLQITIRSEREPSADDAAQAAGKPAVLLAKRALPLSVAEAHELLSSRFEESEAVAQYAVYSSGPIRAAIADRLQHLGLLVLLLLPLFVGWKVLGLFSLGAATALAGRLSPGNEEFWRRTATVGIGAGLPLSCMSSALTLRGYESQSELLRLASPLHELSSYLLAVGIAGAVWHWAANGLRSFVLSGLAAVGRTALSNYIGQSIVMSLVATSYGLGLYGDLTRLELLALAVSCFSAQLLASSWWLSRFYNGPLEWLWRCFTYWRWLPLRRGGG